MKTFPELMDEDAVSPIDAAIMRDATRRPQSRFAAACLTPAQNNEVMGIIDDAIEQLQLLKRQIQRHAQ